MDFLRLFFLFGGVGLLICASLGVVLGRLRYVVILSLAGAAAV